jgi:hypothetical protein
MIPVFMRQRKANVMFSANCCGLTAVNSWYEHWIIKINEGKSQAIYFSRRLRFPDKVLRINGQDIPFVNNVMYLGVTSNKKMTWGYYVSIGL